VKLSVACEAESKPTSVTPYDGLSLLTLAAMYALECTNVDGYFCQGTTVPAWYHLIGKYNLITYKQARPARLIWYLKLYHQWSEKHQNLLSDKKCKFPT